MSLVRGDQDIFSTAMRRRDFIIDWTSWRWAYANNYPSSPLYSKKIVTNDQQQPYIFQYTKEPDWRGIEHQQNPTSTHGAPSSNSIEPWTQVELAWEEMAAKSLGTHSKVKRSKEMASMSEKVQNCMATLSMEVHKRVACSWRVCLALGRNRTAPLKWNQSLGL